MHDRPCPARKPFLPARRPWQTTRNPDKRPTHPDMPSKNTALQNRPHPPQAAAIGSGQSRDGRQQCAGHRSLPCRPGPLPAPDSSVTDGAHGRNPSMTASRMAFERITIRRGFLQSPAFHQDRKIPHPHRNSALCLSGDAGLPACDARNAGHRSARRPFQTIPLARRNLAKGMMPITRECAIDPPLPAPFPRA